MLGLSGCSSIDVSESAWTRCTVGGTVLVGATAVVAGLNLVTGVSLGLANSGLGCFLVYENMAARTENRLKAESEQNAPKATVSATDQPVNSGNAAFPVVPLFPALDSTD